MSVTQFAMVEELASLIKDNFSSRHLVLAVEEALVNYLQGDPSPDGTLELEPMSSYDRLIIHRLADIFGFIHESVGEGDDRHLVLQQCLETSMPSIFVIDILWQYDARDSPSIPYQLLKRDEACTVMKMNIAPSTNLFEREAAYLAARRRIFGADEVELKESVRQKSRNVPVVARRMIAHALGQRISHCNHSYDQTTVDEGRLVNLDLNPETSLTSNVCTDKNVKCSRAEGNDNINDSRKEPNRNSSGVGPQVSGRNRLTTPKISMKEENVGAAERMFAQALGIQASKDGVSRESKSY